jgi:predicted RNase H-like HicB family nuclease
MALRRKIDVTFKLDGMIREDKETGSFVSFCPQLELYSAGRTRMEARQALNSAIEMFLRLCYERQILGQVLHERNFKPTDPNVVAMTPTEDFTITIKETLAEYDDAFSVEIPIHLLAQQNKIAAAGV